MPFLIHALVLPLNISVVAVESFVLPWGEPVAMPIGGPPGWWVGPVFLVGFVIQGFALHCGGQLWRRDRVAGAYVLLATLGTLGIFTLEALRSFQVAAPPILGAFPSVLWVGAMALVIDRGHQQTRKALAASEQRFRGIFDGAFQLTGLLRTDGGVIEINRTALEFSGAQAADVIGKPFWEAPWWSHSPALQERVADGNRCRGRRGPDAIRGDPPAPGRSTGPRGFLPQADS